MRRNTEIVIILALALLARLFLYAPGQAFWDEALYVGMGKYLYSQGAAGLWEPLRPVGLPIAYGAAWRIGIDPLVFGRLLALISCVAATLLVYLIAERCFDRRSALLASLMFTLAPLSTQLSYRLLNDMPSLALTLLSVLLLMRKQPFFAGIAWSVALLTRYSALIVLPAFVIYAYQRKRLWQFMLAAALILLPFLIVNQSSYGDAFLPFTQASEVITQVVGCNYLFYHPWYYYLATIFLENPLLWLAPVGIYLAMRVWSTERTLLLLLLMLPLCYYSWLHCRDYRYALSFLPLFALFAAHALSSWSKRMRERSYLLAVIALAVLLMVWSIHGYRANVPTEPLANEEFYRFLADAPRQGEALVASPWHTLYTDRRLTQLYYPIFDSELSASVLHRLADGSSIAYILLDDCGGGIICPPPDVVCRQNLARIMGLLAREYTLLESRTVAGCEYVVYTTATS